MQLILRKTETSSSTSRSNRDSRIVRAIQCHLKTQSDHAYTLGSSRILDRQQARNSTHNSAPTTLNSPLPNPKRPNRNISPEVKKRVCQSSVRGRHILRSKESKVTYIRLLMMVREHGSCTGLIMAPGILLTYLAYTRWSRSN